MKNEKLHENLLICDVIYCVISCERLFVDLKQEKSIFYIKTKKENDIKILHAQRTYISPNF